MDAVLLRGHMNYIIGFRESKLMHSMCDQTRATAYALGHMVNAHSSKISLIPSKDVEVACRTVPCQWHPAENRYLLPRLYSPSRHLEAAFILCLKAVHT